jgi:hypothetical protein
MAKLTLSVEPDKIVKAKLYASKHKTSISKLFSDFISTVSAADEAGEDDPFLLKIKQIEIPDWVKKLSVDPKLNRADDFDYKKLKHEYLKERHGF